MQQTGTQAMDRLNHFYSASARYPFTLVNSIFHSGNRNSSHGYGLRRFSVLPARLCLAENFVYSKSTIATEIKVLDGLHGLSD